MIETLKYIYDKFYEQVKYAETKHSISLTLASALAIFSSTYLIESTPLETVLSSSSIIFALTSALCNFFALYDHKFNTKYSKGDINQELFSYKNVAKFGTEDYLKALAKKYGYNKDYKNKGLEIDLADQVIQTARSIKKKFSYFNYGITFLLVSLFCEASVVVVKALL